MNWSAIEGNWKQLKGEIKEQWGCVECDVGRVQWLSGKVADDHIDNIAGKREQLSGKIQQAYGVSKDATDAQNRRLRGA